MAGEWIPVQLGDVTDLLTGFPFKSDGYVEDASAPRLLRGDNVAQGALRWDGAKRWPADAVDEVALYQLREGDVILAMDRPWIEAGLKYASVRRSDLPALLVQRVARIRGTSRLDTGFLKYLIGGRAFTDHVLAFQTGTAVPHISGSQIKSFAFLLPPLPEQRAIAHILLALDDKIELNRRMSGTLEAMARALFKSWFVDFDPVRAKAEGRSPGLPLPLADLFPARLVDSELGEIPEGWMVKTLDGELTELVSGARPKGGAVEKGVPSIGAENVLGLGRYDFSREKFVPSEFFTALKSRGAEVRRGDVLLYKDGAQIGRKTYFDRGFPHAECAINEHVFILRSSASWMQRFLFLWLDLPWMTSEIISLNSNSAQPGINQGGVRQLPLLRPSDELIRAFDRIIAPLTDALFRGCHESRTLAALRDTLLPKLVSGELSVEQQERFVESQA